MFDWVQNNRRIMQVLLVLIAIPFALFGVESYQRMFSTVDQVAKVDGVPVSVGELNRAVQSQLDQVRQILGAGFDASMWDTEKSRRDVLDGLVNERIVQIYSQKARLSASDAALQQAIAAMPAFQENGKFSQQRYTELLRAQNYTPIQFQETLRQQLAVRRLVGGITDSAIVSRVLANQDLALNAEQRAYSRVSFSPRQYMSQVHPSDEAIAAYYKENPTLFEIPARIRIEYVALNQNLLLAQEQVDPAEVKKVYDETFAAAASARDAAHKKALGLLANLRAHPDQFEAVAKAQSEDPGSAANGGDLGYFGHGAMVKPFEVAAFSLKPGQISDLVQTNFGYHIIKVTGARKADNGEERQASHILIKAPEGAKSFAEASAQISANIKRQRVSARYAKVLEDFQNLADQDNDSLAPFVQQFKLAVQTTDWVTHTADPKLGLVGNAKVIDALFSADSIKTRHATEAIEASPGNIVVARVLDHKAADLRPLESVRADIVARLTEREAVKLAGQAGKATLAELNADKKPSLDWVSGQTVSRERPAGLSADAVKAIFAVDPGKLPQVVGAEGTEGYTLYRVEQVLAAPAVSTEQSNAALEAQKKTQAQADLRLFVAGLRERAKVEINNENLARK